MTKRIQALLSAAAMACVTGVRAQEATITVQADKPGHRISRYLTGACIEDVNHEIYGGIYSQMVFGESFQEPAMSAPPKGFLGFGGTWTVKDGELRGSAGSGFKLVSELPAFADGEVGVEVLFADRTAGNAGLIARVAAPGMGANKFDGYEISLNPAAQTVLLGRHRHDWHAIKEVPCEVPLNQWIPLAVKFTGQTIEVLVNGRTAIRHDDEQASLPAGTVGLRQWQREARYRNLWVKAGEAKQTLAFERATEQDAEVSSMWRPVQRKSVAGACSIEKDNPFVGTQSQRITFSSGEGEWGIENQGLNRWGMAFVGGKPYEGILWARADKPVEIWATLESADGTRVHAEQRLVVDQAKWQRLEFSLTPKSDESKGRFAIALRQPGSVVLGYALLQPGEWGRFKGLPVRLDVAEGLIDQGITVLRYGGSMINHAEYRWKKMLGPRDRRPPHAGTWYAYSSNGWGILDFLDFCEAAGFLAIPAFNMNETPQDMADFIEYVNGPADSPWGSRRVADGHPKPYQLRHLELGNEERVDEAYAAKFEALAQAIWAKDSQITLVVGDFAYGEPIRNPLNFRGAASGITSLAGQQRILQFTKQHDREVWFDLHVGTDGPRPDSTFAGMLSFADALDKMADGARHKVVVFEFNSGNHSQRRALANALAINAIERDGRIPIALAANCLQPDGQNDNDWDQGLLFLDPSQVWLQPPGWVTRMISADYQPLHVPTTIAAADPLDVSAKRSEDGRTLVLQVVNVADKPVAATIKLEGFTPSRPTAAIAELAGDLGMVNTAEEPKRLVPRQSTWQHEAANGTVHRTFAPHSLTMMRFE